MLRHLLSLIVAGEMTSFTECAAALGVKPDTLDEMIARLVALGYIENASASCASAFAAASAAGSAAGTNACVGACKGCAMAASCHGGLFVGRKGIAWQLTAKGRAAAAAAAPDVSSAPDASSAPAQEFRR